MVAAPAVLKNSRVQPVSWRNIMSEHSQRFLTPDDLYQLTGYRRPSLQCKALKESGVFFIPRKDGRPGTTWEHVSNPVGLKLVIPDPDEEQPNFKDM